MSSNDKPGIALLSLDGGKWENLGALTQIHVVEDILNQYELDNDLEEGSVRVPDVFDLVLGTGTGGLVACMLGPLGMSPGEAKKAYLRIYNSRFLAQPEPSKCAEILQRQIESLLDSHTKTSDIIMSTMRMSDVRKLIPNCKFGMTAMTAANLSKPVLLRAYQGRGISVQSTLLEALLATLSDGQILPPVAIGEDIPELFVSTAAGFCNPTESLLAEIPSIFKARDISVIVSIGSGRPDPAALIGGEDFANAVQSLAASCHIVAENMQSRFSHHPGLFVRLDTDGFDISKILQPGEIISHCRAYMNKEEIREIVDALSHSLTERPKRLKTTQISGLKSGVIEEIKLAVGESRLSCPLEFESNIRSEAIYSAQESHILERLNISNNAPFSSAVSKDVQRQSCTPGTRVSILRKLLDWATIYDPTLKGTLFWLYGLAGTGKTTILQDICETLQKRRLLASSYFCSIQLTSGDSRCLVPTIARHLASCSQAFGSALVSQLRQDPDLVSATLKLQFMHLLCQPWKEAAEAQAGLSYTARVVVIDALDECDRGEEFLDLLLDAIDEGQLKGIRFIVASRPVPHLLNKIYSMRPDTPQVSLHEVPKEEIDGDIQRYLGTRLAAAPSRIDDLVARADGLFIYASTLVKYLSPSQPLAPSELNRRLEKVLSRKAEISSINTLYKQVIDAALSLDENDEREGRLAIIHAIICAAEPPSAAVIAGLLNVELSLVTAVVTSLHSVLFTAGNGGPIYIFHASFHDFILSGMDEAFMCQPPSIHCTLARACLAKMSDSLRFNICQLESSFIPDADLVPPIEKRTAEHIGDFLAYASRNWWVHIERCNGQGRSRLFPRIEPMLREKGIFWIEAMSLLGDIRRCKEILLQITSASGIVQQLPTIRALASDASSLVSRFEAIPSKLTSHLYLSCLGMSERTPNLDYWRSKFQYLPQAMSQQRNGRRHCKVVVDVKLCVKSVAFSPDGTRVVSSSDDNIILVWDSESGKEVQQLHGHTDYIRSVTFSPNGMSIISGSLDKTIRIWDSQSGKERQRLKGHTGHILSVAFSPDGMRIASGAGDKTVRIWNSETGKSIQRLHGHMGHILSVCFSPDGMLVASGSIDKTIRIWDLESGKEVLQLNGHTSIIRSVAFSPAGVRIVSGSEDETIRIWDFESGQEIQQIKGHIGSIQSVGFSPDGMCIISGSSNGTACIWNSESGTAIWQLEGHNDCIRSVASSADGLRIASGSDDKTIRIWDTSSREELRQLDCPTDALRSVAFSPDGMYIVSGCVDKTISIWDSESGEEIWRRKGHTSSIQSVAFSPDGKLIVSAGGFLDKTIRIWDSGSGTEIRQLKGHTGCVRSAAFLTDGIRIISCSDDATIRIWDSKSGKELQRLKHHHFGALSVAFSADGKCIVSGSEDKTICIWDSESGKEVRRLKDPAEYTRPVAITPNEVGMDSSSDGKTNHLRKFEPGGHSPLFSGLLVHIVAFSPDGRHIVSSFLDRTIRLWDSESGEEVRKLNGHTGYIRSVIFFPDGKHIVSGSDDKTIRIWESRSGKEVRRLSGHTGSIHSIAFSPDGMRIVSGSEDQTIRVWSARQDEMRANPRVHTDDVLSIVFKREIRRLMPAGYGFYGSNFDSSLSPQTTLTTSVSPVTLSSRPCSLQSKNSSVPTAQRPFLSPLSTVILDQTSPTLSCRDDGWLVTSEEYTGAEKKLLWIPPALRPFDPAVLLVISWDGFNSIDMAGCVFGQGWEQCYIGMS
ncbi:WD40-repeat-containing domain protein [Flagelloscypha sp. PMI_526]|nr:WD40-repeat-containing domain protein [Flagelloscypha sp. PMI_526]